MFGKFKKKKQDDFDLDFNESRESNESFRLPIDDHEALNIVEERRTQRFNEDYEEDYDEYQKEPEPPKKKFGFFGKGKGKKSENKEKRKPVKRSSGTGRKKLIKYYRRILGVGLICSMLFLFFSFGGRFVVNSVNAPKNQNAIPPSSRNLYNDFNNLKQRYDKFNFDTFRLLVEGESRSKPQTDEEKISWRNSLGTLFGNNYITEMKGRVREIREEERDVQIAREDRALTKELLKTTYSVIGVSRTGNRILITLRGSDGTEYWTFNKAGISNDAPEGFIAYGLDMVGTETSAPGFYLGITENKEDGVFIPLSGTQSHKVDSGAKKLQETKRKQSYAAVTTPDGKHKMVSMRQRSQENKNMETTANSKKPTETATSQNAPQQPVNTLDGSVQEIIVPSELSGQIQDNNQSTMGE